MPAAVRPTVLTEAQVPLLLPGSTIATQIFSFHGLRDSREHIAIRVGEPDRHAPLVRLHSECLTGDVFSSARCDCGPQLQEALELMGGGGGGYVLYLRQEGRGIGLYEKLAAYRLQETGQDTYEANRALGHGEDERQYGVAADMLHALGVTAIKLLTNNPDKVRQLQAEDIDVVAVNPTGVHANEHNLGYLQAKFDHTKHTLNLEGLPR